MFHLSIGGEIHTEKLKVLDLLQVFISLENFDKFLLKYEERLTSVIEGKFTFNFYSLKINSLLLHPHLHHLKGTILDSEFSRLERQSLKLLVDFAELII